MPPEDYIRIVRASFDAAMGSAQPEPSPRGPDEFGNRQWRFRSADYREVEVAIHASGLVDGHWTPSLSGQPTSSSEHVTEDGARALGERIARYMKGDDTAATGPDF